jgi:uncharacterized protein YggT (Ycf19 family)
MYQLITLLEIIIGWIVIFEIFQWMIDDGLFKEVQNLIDVIRRRLL